MQILAISRSLRSGSANSSLVRTLSDVVPYNVTVSIYDGLAELPPFNADLDDNSPPLSVVHMRQVLRGADAVLLCTPEYIHGIPGSLKNALDWTASSGKFVDKPVDVISASPSPMGGDRAHAALVHTLTVLSAEVVEGGTLIVPRVRSKVTSEGTVTDPETLRALRSVADALAQTVATRLSVSTP